MSSEHERKIRDLIDPSALRELCLELEKLLMLEGKVAKKSILGQLTRPSRALTSHRKIARKNACSCGCSSRESKEPDSAVNMTPAQARDNQWY